MRTYREAQSNRNLNNREKFDLIAKLPNNNNIILKQLDICNILSSLCLFVLFKWYTMFHLTIFNGFFS